MKKAILFIVGMSMSINAIGQNISTDKYVVAVHLMDSIEAIMVDVCAEYCKDSLKKENNDEMFRLIVKKINSFKQLFDIKFGVIFDNLYYAECYRNEMRDLEGKLQEMKGQTLEEYIEKKSRKEGRKLKVDEAIEQWDGNIIYGNSSNKNVRVHYR